MYDSPTNVRIRLLWSYNKIKKFIRQSFKSLLDKLNLIIDPVVQYNGLFWQLKIY